jgi:polyisoprenoid-binding protein YceI
MPRITTALVTLILSSPALGEPLEATPEGSGIRVHVAKRGLFSAFAHDHDFEVTRWRGSAELPAEDPERASLEVVLDADSLRDREPGLSDEDRHKVETQTAGPAVLDAARTPEIVYRAQAMSLSPSSAAKDGPLRGVLHGVLTLRGRARPMDASFEATRDADAWHVRGQARFSLSEFGIEPMSGFAGTVGVKNRVEVTFSLKLGPAVHLVR